jgi:hypothetical protein
MGINLGDCFMKRLPEILCGSAFVFVILLLLVAVYATTNNKPSLALGNRAQDPAQAVVPAVAPVASGLFVASELPVTIAVGAPNSSKGFSEIPLLINTKTGSKVTNLNLVLFEISQTGKLLGAESINGAVDLTEKSSDNLPLHARKLVKPGSQVIMALESVSGPDGSWQIDLPELLEGAVAVASNKPVPAVNVSQKRDRHTVDYGSNHCARAFALASHLSKFSESGGMPSFYCDQQTRGYFFSYSTPGKTQ